MRIALARIISAAVLATSTVALVQVAEASATVPAPFDTSFGTNGIAELTLPNVESTTSVTEVVEDSSGRLLGLLEIDGYRVAVVRLLANGNIDTTFGESGRSQFLELSQASMQVQSDGKILVAGYVPGKVLPEIFLTRINTSGIVDTSFGTNGSKTIGGFPGKMLSSSSRLLFQFDAINEAIYLGFQSPTALPSSNAHNTFTFMSMTQNGEFRTDWARDGSREIVPWAGGGPASSILLDMKVLSDGSLIAVGSSFNANADKQITLIKLTSSGWLDFDFDGPSGDSNGLVKVNFATETEAHMSAILPLGDGSFYLAGTAGTLYSGPRYYGMAKFASDGTPDSSFSSDGFALTQLQTDANTAFVPVIDRLQNGNVVFPVDVNSGTGYATFTPSGDVPTTSNCTTCLWNPSNETVRTHNLLVNSVGNVLIVGRNMTTNRFFGTLFTSSGTINHSFQTPDVRFYFVRWSVEAYKSIPQTDGSIIVLAFAESESGIERGVIFKLTAQGVMDQQFGAGGYSYLNSAYEDRSFWVSDAAVLPNGKILVVGSANDDNYQSTLILWRLNSDGSADNTFGTNGRTVTTDQAANLYPSTLIVQSNGKILLGVDRRENNVTLPWLYRYQSNGTLDISFTDSAGFQGGIQPTNNEGEGWGAWVFPAPNGAVYFTSKTTINNQIYLVLMRLQPDGSPDQTFGSNSRRTWNESDPNAIDWIADLVVDNNGKVMLLGSEDEPSPERSVIVRLNSDGSDDITFNSTGYSFFVLRDPSTARYVSSYAMVLSGNNFLVAGGGSIDQSGNQLFSAIAKLGSNTALDTSFGSGGVVQNAASDNSIFYGIEKLTNSTSLVTGLSQENGIKTGVVMKVSHQMPPTTTTPTLLAPINGAQFDLAPAGFTVTGSFPDTVLSGSIQITLTTSDNGGAKRTISVTDRQSLNVTFDPLEPESGILNNSWASAVVTTIAGSLNSTQRMPDGTYTVSIEYRSATGGPVAMATATTVVFRSKCPPGTFSATSFVPCTAASAGSFQNLYGATASVSCPAGTYQPTSGSTFCLTASPGHFVDAPGRSFQTPSPPGRFVATQGATSATMCAPGTYQPDASAITCLNATTHHFVPVQGSSTQFACPSGTHAPNAQSTSCIALSQDAPTTIAPVTTTPPTTTSPPTTIPNVETNADDDVKMVISVSQVAVLRRLQITVPRGGKVTMASRTPRVCRISKNRVQATSTGTCRVAVTVTDKKKKTTRTLALRVS